MTDLRLDHIVLVTPNLDSAAEPFQRLGFTLTPRMEHAGGGTANRVFFVGGPQGHFYVELLTVHDREAAAGSGAEAYVKMQDAGGGVARLMLSTDDLEGSTRRLKESGAGIEGRETFRADGSKIADVAIPNISERAGCEVGILQYVADEWSRYESRRARGLFDHGFPAQRLDHLAMIPVDPASAEAFWTDVLALPVHGEVQTPAMTIRQLKAGDAILELLVPSGPESPVAARPKGLIPMVALEVPNLAEAVELARARGFSPLDPADGVLPGTRTATIPPNELSGLGLQLLEYV